MSISPELGEPRTARDPGRNDRLPRAGERTADRVRPRRGRERRPLAPRRPGARGRGALHRSGPSARRALPPAARGHRHVASRPRADRRRLHRVARPRGRHDRRQRHRRRGGAVARGPPRRADRAARAHVVRRVREVPADSAALPRAGRARSGGAAARGLVGSVQARAADCRRPTAGPRARRSTRTSCVPSPTPSARTRACDETSRGCCTRSTRATRTRRPSRCAASTSPRWSLWAADDKLFPLEHGRRLAELLPQGRFTTIANSRTFIPEEQPERLAAVVRDFVAEDVSAATKTA